MLGRMGFVLGSGRWGEQSPGALHSMSGDSTALALRSELAQGWPTLSPSSHAARLLGEPLSLYGALCGALGDSSSNPNLVLHRGPGGLPPGRPPRGGFVSLPQFPRDLQGTQDLVHVMVAPSRPPLLSCFGPPPFPPAASLSTAARATLSATWQGGSLLSGKPSSSRSEHKPQFLEGPGPP